VLSHSSSYRPESFFVGTLLSHFWMLIAQLFFTATVFSHSLCKNSSVIFDVIVLSHFSLLQYSVVFRCYGPQPCFTAAVLDHSSLLQCVRQLSHFVKWPSSVAGGRRRAARSHSWLDHGCPGLSRAGLRVVRDQATWGVGQTRTGSVGWVQCVCVCIYIHTRRD
jgi:hypothetical protein